MLLAEVYKHILINTKWASIAESWNHVSWEIERSYCYRLVFWHLKATAVILEVEI